MIFIAAFVAIAIGFYFIQKNKIRSEERRESMQIKQQELLDKLRSKETPGSPTNH